MSDWDDIHQKAATLDQRRATLEQNMPHFILEERYDLLVDYYEELGAFIKQLEKEITKKQK